MMRTIFTVLAFGVTMALAQRRLALPDPRSCANRVRHATYRDARGVAHSYFFSWEHAPTKSLEVDWLDSRNICRRHCMDAVSLETPQVIQKSLNLIGLNANWFRVPSLIGK